MVIFQTYKKLKGPCKMSQVHNEEAFNGGGTTPTFFHTSFDSTFQTHHYTLQTQTDSFHRRYDRSKKKIRVQAPKAVNAKVAFLPIQKFFRKESFHKIKAIDIPNRYIYSNIATQ